MDESSLEDLRKELASLEAAETTISAERRHLHNQIDYGYATEATRAREREVSAERRQLHQRIDALRDLLREQDPLGESESEPSASQPSSPFSEWSGISADVVAEANASADELEQ